MFKVGDRVWVKHFKEGGTVVEIFEGNHYSGTTKLVYRTKMDQSEGHKNQDDCLDWFDEYLEEMTPLRELL